MHDEGMGYAAFREGLFALEREADLRIEALLRSGREDEANLQKAGRNICRMLRREAEGQASLAALRARMDALHQDWTRARVTAALGGEYARVAVENEKLSALAKARALLARAEKEGTA